MSGRPKINGYYGNDYRGFSKVYDVTHGKCKNHPESSATERRRTMTFKWLGRPSGARDGGTSVIIEKRSGKRSTDGVRVAARDQEYLLAAPRTRRRDGHDCAREISSAYYWIIIIIDVFVYYSLEFIVSKWSSERGRIRRWRF